MLYDPSYSENGVLRAAARKPRAASTFDFEVSKEALCEGRPIFMLKGTTFVSCRDIAELVVYAGASHHQKPPRAANVPGRKSARWWRAQEEGESICLCKEP